MLGRFNEALQFTADVVSFSSIFFSNISNFQNFSFHEQFNMSIRLLLAFESLIQQLAPPPTPLQNFEYHWKHVKNFYAQHKIMPKIHIENTNLPVHLEEMLKLLIEEDLQKDEVTNSSKNAATPTKPVCSDKIKSTRECFDFVLTNRPIDLLTDICLTDSPVGASVCVLNWMRRFLTCLQDPRLDHKSILQPTQVVSSLVF